jgi:hypothetical protein
LGAEEKANAKDRQPRSGLLLCAVGQLGPSRKQFLRKPQADVQQNEKF